MTGPDLDQQLDRRARAYHAARRRTERAKDDLIATLLDASAAGRSESELARRAGVTRVTVRSWLGKQ